MHFIAKPEYTSPWNLCIKAKPQFMAYGCFMEDTELGSHLSIKTKYFWPEGDRFRQVPLYSIIVIVHSYNFLFIAYFARSPSKLPSVALFQLLIA